MKIHIHDPIICQADNHKMVAPLIQVKRTFWKKGEYSKERKDYTTTLVTKGVFLYGFLPRIKKALQQRNIPFEVIGNFDPLPYKDRTISIYTLRPDQQKLVDISCSVQRGVIVSPTGTGKTVIIGHIANNFMPHKVLFLCHTISLVTQSYEEFKKMNLNTSLLYGKEKDLSGKVVVSTIQTISKYPIEEICDLFDVVLIDEAHHASSFSGQWHKLLTSMLAPVRLGFTATVPKEGTEEAMALEGLIGPVIGEFDMEEAMEKEILAVPKVKLIAVPKNTNLQDLKTYKDIYRVGIVNNRMRNKAIARLLLSLKQEGKTTLVYINHLEHIQRVVDELDHSVQCEIVEGNVSIREREKIKASLLAKKIDVVIASTAWKEGINIPTVDYIVNAGGGKAEIAVLQIPGRGLRRAPGKEEAFIVDFLDQGRYLSEHMSERLNIYANKGWL